MPLWPKITGNNLLTGNYFLQKTRPGTLQTGRRVCYTYKIGKYNNGEEGPWLSLIHICFSDQEREKLTQLLAAGFADTFRTLHPEEITYSWWSYRFHAREKNAGWRIDYFIVSRRLLPRVTEAAIRTEVYGSDHCPVVLEIS